MAYGYYIGDALVALMTFMPLTAYMKLEPPKCPNCPLFDYMRPYEKMMDAIVEA